MPVPELAWHRGAREVRGVAPNLDPIDAGDLEPLSSEEGGCFGSEAPPRTVRANPVADLEGARSTCRGFLASVFPNEFSRRDDPPSRRGGVPR